MGPKIKLSYVLPTFNEVENLDILFKQIKQFRKNSLVEFIFIDDNSTDGTFEYLLEQQEKYHFFLCQLPNYKKKGFYMTQIYKKIMFFYDFYIVLALFLRSCTKKIMTFRD